MPLFGKIAVCLLAISIAGCETTGDPRQGGLFGWSEKKAQQRQQTLEHDDVDAQRQLSSEQQHQVLLQKKQSGLETESARLQGEVDRLMTENTQLETELRGLLHEKSLDEAELGRLNGVLLQNAQLRRQLRSGSAGAPPAGTQPDLVNDQNNKLHQEILLLLKR